MRNLKNIKAVPGDKLLDIPKKQFAEGGPISLLSSLNSSLMSTGQTLTDLALPDDPNKKPSMTKGVIKGAMEGQKTGGMFGAATGALTGFMQTKNQQKEFGETQLLNNFRKNALLAANLPGQPSYVPTFETGGFVSPELLGFIKANGGPINSSSINDQKNTTYYPTGGTHNSNPNQGIPIGKDALVEQGEFRYDSKTKGSYIFSSRF